MGVYAPSNLVEAPACVPPRFGLLSVATVIDDPDNHNINGIKYKPNACVAPLGAWDPSCPPNQPDLKTPTDVASQNLEVDGVPFLLYATRTCKTTTLAAMREEVRADFLKGEERGVEREIWNRLLAQPTAVVLNATPTPADALPLVAAVAALESYTREHYSCRSIFHGDSALIPYAAKDRQVLVGNAQLSTVLGTAWAAYNASVNTGPDGTPAPAGYAWLYATSGLVLRRFSLDVPEAAVILVRDAATGGQTNEPFALAERAYTASIECGVAAVLVCLGC